MLALRRYQKLARVANMVRPYSGSGETGAFRGEQSSDSFTKRERAQEDYYIKQHEKEALAKLRKEIEEREKEVQELKQKEHSIKNK